MNCQINIGGKPFSLENTSWQSSIPVVTTSALNMTTINSDDIADSIANQPPRFGFPHAVSYNLTNSGIWKTLPNGEVYVCWADYTNGSIPAQNMGFASGGFNA